MDDYESLSHSKWECKYHVVFIPKYRRKTLYGKLRQHLGEVFRKLAMQKESRVEEGHLMPDHVHMMISIPPKYAVSQVIGYIKGESAFHLAHQEAGGRGQPPRSTEHVALKATFRWPTEPGSHQRPQRAASSGRGMLK